MRRHQGFFLGLALSALIGLSANQAQAGAIQIIIALGGIPIFTMSSTSPDEMINVDVVGLNHALAAQGSEYQFVSLGGTSNYTGTGSGPIGTGFLEVHGELQIPANSSGTNTPLIVTETQSGFLAPTGATATLTSISAGTFTNEAINTGYTVSSACNISSSPFIPNGSVAYNIWAPYNGNSFFTNGPGGASTTTPSALTSGYQLTNVVTFGLVPFDPTQTVDLKFLPQVTLSSVPEPASVVILLTGLSLPLVYLSVRRRRHPGAQSEQALTEMSR